MDTASEEEDFEAWLAYRKAKRATRGSGEPNKRAKTEGGDYGSRDKWDGRRILSIGAWGGETGVARVTANSIMLPSVRERRIGEAALLPR